MIRVGECQYDPAAEMLLDKDGKVLPLRRKSIQTLSILAETPGRLVGKDAIVSRVWAGVTVTDESLSQCIRDIRKALGDDARQIIQTVPGRGFLLVATPTTAGPPSGMPVISVRAIEIRSGGEEALHLGERIRQEIVRSISRRTGIRIATDASKSGDFDYVIRGTISSRNNALDVFMEIEETGGRGIFFAEVFELLDQPREEFVARLARKVTNVQRVSAIAHFGKRLLSEPDQTLDLQQLLQKAAYHYSRITTADTGAAERILTHATERFPESPMALAMLAATYVHMYPLIAIDRSQHRVQEAMEIAERAVFAGPEVDFALRTRGNLKFWLQQDIDGALADCHRAMAITPNFQLAHLTRVQIDLFNGEVDAARTRFEQHIEVDIALPQYHYFQTLLSIFALHDGDIENARRHAREAVEFAPWSDWGTLVLSCTHADDPATLPRGLSDRIRASKLESTHFEMLPSKTPAFLASLADLARKFTSRSTR